MANCIVFPRHLIARGVMEFPADRGKWKPQYLASVSLQLLDTDPIGSIVVTFAGVNANSEIRVYSNGTELAGVENCDADHTLQWDVYGTGSPNNNVTIKIVNLLYKTIVVNYVSYSGIVTFPIQQTKDTWYKNPT